MGKIYVNQTALRLQLYVGTDVDTALSLKIKYTKPDSETIYEFIALEPTDAVKSIYYDFQEGDLNVAGQWIFWAYVTFSDGRSAPGEPVKIRVWEEGT